MEVFVEHNQQLNGPHVAMDVVKIKAKLSESESIDFQKFPRAGAFFI
jgi:hypothetical protein